VPAHEPTLDPTPRPTIRPSEWPSAPPTAGTVAGVTTVALSNPMAVSEDGSLTSSFTVALTAEPVSDVLISFGSASGSIVCTPSEVTLDYTNYAAGAVVIVSALDDAVDQGEAHADAVTVTVASLDSADACVRQGRERCGQAASFNGHAVPSVAISVQDDDTAAVVVSALRLDATYDNHGDALEAAVYTIALASEPTANVTVTVSGLCAYSTAVPHSLTFSAATWATAQAVRVLASAPTSARPACASGNRFCAALEGRSEAVAHAVESDDARYSGISVGVLSVAVAVVHDAADPPKVAFARFSDLLNALIVTFASATNRAAQAGSFTCALVFELTAAQDRGLFGPTGACSFASDSELVATFGAGASAEPGTTLRLRDGTIKAAAGAGGVVSLYTVNETATFGQPLVPTAPSVVLAASSAFVGRCDGLILDGSASSGSGGRDMDYSFSVVAESGHSVTNLTAALAIANARRGGRGWHKVAVASEDMVPGSTFTVTLTATNFLGNSDSATVTVAKLQVPAPVIRIQGGDRAEGTHSSALTLRASAQLAEMICVGSRSNDAKMSFLWAEETGLFGGALIGTSRNPRVLSINAGALAAATTYSFRVTGFMTDFPNVNNSATVSVVVGQQALKAVVGSAFRQVGRDSAFTLNGASSYDPDESAVPFSYAWSCAGASSGATCGSLSLASSATATVAANALAIGTYAFTLTVAKTGRGNATATAVVEVMAGSPPAVSVASLAKAKYNTGDGFLALKGAVSSALSFDTEWSSPDSDVASLFRLVSGGTAATVSGKLAAVVAVGALTPGSTYTLRLTATDSDAVAAYSEVTVAVNRPPSSGSVVVAPASGFALDTSFDLTAVNWVDEDAIVGYVFGTTGVTAAGHPDASALFPFGSAGGDATYAGAMLSAGSNATNFTVGCFASAVDSYGAVGTATAVARVRTRRLTVAQLFNVSKAKTAAALDSGDADAARQVLAATTESIKTTTAGGSERRRFLLAMDPEAQALRAAVLANLWSTYAITPVTQADVASLLIVLAGVVDTPSEVTDATAASALSFLSTVLAASEGVGISSTAAEVVAGALSDLFDTEAFGASGGDASYSVAADAVGVLRLTSANQLFGALDGVGAALRSGYVDFYSYRGAAGDLGTLGTLALSGGGSDDGTTAVTFDAAAQAAVLASARVSASDVLDLRVGTLSSNIYAFALEGTAGSDAAVASRLDQTGDALTGNTLLRSRLTVVEVAAEGSSSALSVSGLASPLEVTLKATVPFTVERSEYAKTFTCTTDGASIDLGCPLTADTHTCAFSANGGGKYFFNYECPMVVPTCLWWDDAVGAFSSEGCAVNEGYTAAAVTCSCSHLAPLVLGAALSESSFVAATTAPPSPVPSARPTAPSPRPTTPAPTQGDTAAVAVVLLIDATAPPSDADKAALKLTIASSLGVVSSAVKDLVVTSAPGLRLRRALLAVSWIAQFEVVASLAATSSSDAAAWTAKVSASLEGPAFASALTTAVAAVTSVASVVSSSSGRLSPTPAPAVGPPTPGAVPPTGSGGSGGPDNAILAAAVAGAVAVAAGLFLAARRLRRAQTAARQVDSDAEEEAEVGRKLQTFRSLKQGQILSLHASSPTKEFEMALRNVGVFDRSSSENSRGTSVASESALDKLESVAASRKVRSAKIPPF